MASAPMITTFIHYNPNTQNFEIREMDKKERRETNRAVDKLGRRADKLAAEAAYLTDMVSPRGPRCTAKIGEIKPQIYANGAIITQHNSELAQLPNEMLKRICGLLPLHDAVAFSLTCKQMAGIVDNYRKGATTYAGKARNFNKLEKLEMLVQLRSWVPEKLSLCYRCLKFRARAQDGWTTNLLVTQTDMANQRAINEGPKCPRCNEWMVLSRGRETAVFEKIMKKVRKVVK